MIGNVPWRYSVYMVYRVLVSEAMTFISAHTVKQYLCEVEAVYSFHFKVIVLVLTLKFLACTFYCFLNENLCAQLFI